MCCRCAAASHDGQLRWSSQLWFPRPERLAVCLSAIRRSAIAFPLRRCPGSRLTNCNTSSMRAPSCGPGQASSRSGAAARSLCCRTRSPIRCRRSRAPRKTATELIRPSLCVQARDGRLHVFLPLCLEARRLSRSGCRGRRYLPISCRSPSGWRAIRRPSIRGCGSSASLPIPACSKINCRPRAIGTSLNEPTPMLFEEARKNRLTAEKFAYDGTHLATGGGSHIVIGGASVCG